VHDLIGAHWHDVFLDQHLDTVGHRLKKSERPDAIWPITILHASENFPLQHGNEREECEKHTEQRENVDQRRCDLHHPIRRTRQRREQQLFYVDENLIKPIAHLL
jgi:hypothetical protein